MKIIEKLSKLIDEELEDAEKYARCAMKYGEESAELKQLFLTLSNEEMRHKDMLHAQVVKLIDKYRMEHGDAPVAMQAVYDYLHEKSVERAHKIKALQDEVRGI